jgi:hypothetical protein
MALPASVGPAGESRLPAIAAAAVKQKTIPHNKLFTYLMINSPFSYFELS